MAPLILIVLCLAALQAAPDHDARREARLEKLRARAQERLEADRLVYTATELEDIETRYRSAVFLKTNAAAVLEELAARYPKSTRSGCAVLKLAQHARGESRKRYLDRAIASHGDAWCENGVQVGALARALLAVSYADLGRFDEAERIAREMIRLFPGAVDSAGAPLETVLEGITLLRPPR